MKVAKINTLLKSSKINTNYSDNLSHNNTNNKTIYNYTNNNKINRNPLTEKQLKYINYLAKQNAENNSCLDLFMESPYYFDYFSPFPYFVVHPHSIYLMYYLHIVY